MTLTGAFPLGETVTVVTRTVTGQDPYGDDVFTEATVNLDGCAVWPRTASVGTPENITARDTVITGKWLLLPTGSVVSSISRVVHGGLSYEVEGEPATWHSPLTGKNVGPLVSLRRVTG